MKSILPGVLLALLGAAPSSPAAPSGELQIYFIDVEGGQSTLLVTPDHQTLLIDAGFPADGTFDSRPGKPEAARDANRVVAAAHDAHVARIDYLLNTHFHGDHMGGIPELAQLLPVGTFVDHGSPNAIAETTSPGTLALFAAYEKARSQGRHLEAKPGDRLPMKNLGVEVVSSRGDTLARALHNAGTHNPACQSAAIPAGEVNENTRSTGVLVTFGRFRFLDVGDLTGDPYHRLACPVDLIGPVDVYLVAHHGGADSADPALFAALKPRAAILNNGMKKGGAPETYRLLHEVMGPGDSWQLHRSQAAAEQNFPDPQVANIDESTSHWIKLTARPDGAFSIVNGRTGEAKNYPAR